MKASLATRLARLSEFQYRLPNPPGKSLEEFVVTWTKHKPDCPRSAPLLAEGGLNAPCRCGLWAAVNQLKIDLGIL